MLSPTAPTSATSRPSTTAASVASFAELVKKIETSPAPSSRKRRNTARKKLARIIREQRRLAKKAGQRAIALTLTYRDSTLFSPKHISRFLDCLRSALKRKGCGLPYAWVLEQAGQLHYHLILWLPRNYSLDPTKLSRWWPWGSFWVKSCRSVVAWGKYMAKFDCTRKLPKAARLFGYGGLDEVGKTAVLRAGFPRWLLVVLPAHDRARRYPGGIWVNLTTGEVHRSPYAWTPWGAKLRNSGQLNMVIGIASC